MCGTSGPEFISVPTHSGELGKFCRPEICHLQKNDVKVVRLHAAPSEKPQGCVSSTSSLASASGALAGSSITMPLESWVTFSGARLGSANM